MNQRALMILAMMLVLLGMGGFVVYDMTVNNRLDKVTGKDQQSNWNWNNDWNVEATPVTPEQPDEPIIEDGPQQQIVAQSYQDAIKKSGELGMPVFVYFHADWCHWCTKMKNEVFSDSKVKTMLKNYIVIHVNTDKHPDVSRKFGINSLPSYVITNVDEKNLKSGKGYQAADQFVSWLDNPSLYKQPKKNVTPPNIQPDENDRRWPQPRNDQNRRPG